MAKSFVIGIAGGSGSGKSAIVDQLMRSDHGSRISLLPHDAYYLDGDRMPKEIREADNWDHPDALDNRLFLEHIDRLLSGQDIARPVYDFSTHSRTSGIQSVLPQPVLLLEGILLLAIPEIRRRIDLCIFVDTPPDERIVRRMLRDIAERGRTVESVARQFRSTVRPMHDQFVEPSRAHAHVVIPWDWQASDKPALDVLLARIGVAISATSAVSCD